MLNANIEKVIANIEKELGKDHPLMKSHYAEGFFITFVEEQSIMINGMRKSKHYIIADFTTMMPFDDWEEFQLHSQSLYRQFESIPKWYCC